MTCENCGTTDEKTTEALGHDLKYTAAGSTITETCTRCGHSKTATLTANGSEYNGAAIKKASVEFSGGWLGEKDANITYQNNVNVGTGKATVTINGATATAEFAITKASKYTITLGKLSQTAGQVTGATYTLTPEDSKAVVKIEYSTDGKEWTEQAPTDVGTYNVRASLVSSSVIEVSKEPSYTTGTFTVSEALVATVAAAPTTSTDAETPTTDEDELPFTDVAEDSWEREAVEYVYENDIYLGEYATSFEPDREVTREQVWMVLATLDGSDAETMEDAARWATGKNITDGTDMDSAITREELVTTVWRYAGTPDAPGDDGDLDAFADGGEVSAWAQEAMDWAVESGIINGTSSTTLSPTATATRAQFSTVLMRLAA
jgi:hypothetical protein